MSNTELIPPDPNQCQTEITTTPGARDGAFSVGGISQRTERCKNKPAYIATEKVPDADGLRGSMSLCETCKVQFEKQMPADYADLTPIEA